jgi:protein-tyrosine-phosphatase
VGAPLTPEAKQALRELGVPVVAHSARNLSPEEVKQVERIFCMTHEHRDALIDLEPAAAAKTHCLDPDGDVEDPAGRGAAAYLDCARRIRSLVRLRFDELALYGEPRG